MGAILPLVFLVFAEATITINQTNISSIYLPISEEFNQTVYGLGLLTAVIFLSYGLFEIPGGIIAIKSGPKKIAVFGLALNSFGVIASSFSPQFDVLLAFRFISGIGSAFAFPTLLVLIVRQLKGGSEGLGSGWTVGWSSLGAAIGLIAWPPFAQAEGWRLSIFWAGLISIIPLVGTALLVRGDSHNPSVGHFASVMKKIVKDRKFLLLGLALFGAGQGFAVLSNFLVYYLEQNYSTSPGVAGLVTAISSIVPFFVAPLIGRAHDRVNRLRVYFLIAGLTLFAGLAIVALHGFYYAIVAGVILGFGSGTSFTLGFALAKKYSRKEYESLGIAWVDTFSLTGSIVAPIYFALIVLAYGYPTAWLFAGAASILPIIPLLILFRESSAPDTLVNA